MTHINRLTPQQFPLVLLPCSFNFDMGYVTLKDYTKAKKRSLFALEKLPISMTFIRNKFDKTFFSADQTKAFLKSDLIFNPDKKPYHPRNPPLNQLNSFFCLETKLCLRTSVPEMLLYALENDIIARLEIKQKNDIADVF